MALNKKYTSKQIEQMRGDLETEVYYLEEEQHETRRILANIDDKLRTARAALEDFNRKNP